MRLTYDLDFDRIIRGIFAPVPLEGNRIELKSRTSGGVEWVFVRPNGAAESLHADVEIIFGVKESGDHAGDWLASNYSGGEYTHTKVGSGSSSVYTTPITWDSTELRTLLAADDYVDLAGALKIVEPTRTREALDFTVRVHRTYVDSLEGFPTDPNPDPDDFEQVVNKGEPDGYAPLDADGLLPAEHLPAGLATDAELAAHTGNTSNPHGVTKAQVGLGNADNTSDANKPISTATQTALDGKQSALSAASQAEMEAGTEAALRSMSPLRVAQAIGSLPPRPFDPTQIPELLVAIFPSETTCYTDVARTALAEIGDAVAGIAGSFGTSIHGAQSDVVLRPILRADGLEFDLTDDVISLPVGELTGGSGFTIYATGKRVADKSFFPLGSIAGTALLGIFATDCFFIDDGNGISSTSAPTTTGNILFRAQFDGDGAGAVRLSSASSAQGAFGGSFSPSAFGACPGQNAFNDDAATRYTGLLIVGRNIQRGTLEDLLIMDWFRRVLAREWVSTPD